VSDKLASQFGNRAFITDANSWRLGSEFPNVLNRFDTALQSSPALSGMKPGFPEFRIWSSDAMTRKALAGDPQIYFVPGHK